MIKSNAKSLLDNTAMLYKQTASSRHDVCLDQRSFKCKISENCSNILFILYRGGGIQILSSLRNGRILYCYPARCVSIMFEKE